MRPLATTLLAAASLAPAYAHPFGAQAFSVSSPPPPQAPGPPLTGCTPRGLSYAPAGGASEVPVLFPADDSAPGWCFHHGRLLAPHALAIHAALGGGASAVVDGAAARAFCALEGHGGAGCAAFIIARLTEVAAAPGALTACEYPASGFTPLSVRCEWACLPGHLGCGRACYDPLHDVCVDLDVAPKRLHCAASSQRCVERDGQMACHDVGESVGLCGGCIDTFGGELGGVNCLLEPGVRGARCVRGACVATRCRPGFSLRDGACVGAAGDGAGGAQAPLA
ncbi:hypothetical protein Q8F55_005063 [Vanrija albida]|uniref:Protein CPL1-like domain-containing protein n=1 Tax=Vanrija albida TaxID=181172 RepID=A0ABR3Q130_9TREE